MGAPTKTGDVMKQAAAYYRYLNQGKVWVPKDGTLRRIVDMDPAWRHNAARFLLRRASDEAMRYDLGQLVVLTTGLLAPSPDSMAADDLDAALEADAAERALDPEVWIRRTPLYQALTAELGRHWSDCPARTAGGSCTCWARHLSECPKRQDIGQVCRCRDYSPEWTL